jgi:hypothetical protein
MTFSKRTKSENTEEEVPLTNLSDSLSKQTLTDTNFDVPEHLTPIVRKYYVTFDGSLSDMAQDEEMASWSPLQSHMDIFQSKTRYKVNAQRSDVPLGDLEQVIMIGMKVKRADSTFPCPLGLTISGSPGNIRTGNGERYSYVLASGEKSHNLNEIIVTTNPFVNSEYIKTYNGKVTGANLRKDIIDFPNDNFQFVPKDHPVIDIMRDNADVLHVNMDEAQLVDGRWYKIGRNMTERCLSELETELVSNLPLINLNEFKVSVQRPHGVAFNDPTGVCDNVSDEDKIEKWMNRNYSANIILELTYAFA